MPKGKLVKLLDAGAEILLARGREGRVDLKDIMKMLGSFGIMSVLIEGGAEVNASALKSGIVDKVVMFIAPRLMTGTDSLCSIGGKAPAALKRAVMLQDVTSRFVGRDLMIEGYIRQTGQRLHAVDKVHD
jgi:diaminohydroxyphosphoribosylaminopyrimidine deaminase/5-amino-6-(5-phosphoribosylamino)uracil reductase